MIKISQHSLLHIRSFIGPRGYRFSCGYFRT